VAVTALDIRDIEKASSLTISRVIPKGISSSKSRGNKFTIDKRNGSVIYWGRSTASHEAMAFHMDAKRNSQIRKTLRPRVRTALRLVLSGATRTQGEAARIAGLHQAYLSGVKRSPIVQAYIRKLEAQMDAQTINMSAAMQELGRKGLLKIAEFMESEQVKDELRLRAAMDLADRSPETSKTSKLSIEGDLTIRQGDANRLIEALVEATQADERYAREVSQGDYVKVDDGIVPVVTASLPAPPRTESEGPRNVIEPPHG